MSAWSENAVGPEVAVIPMDGKIRVELNGELFTEYIYTEAQRPYLYPVIGPTGAPITRNWPMKEGENEKKDHGHHKSLWFTHGDVNGIDFWTDGDDKGRIETAKILKLVSGETGVIQVRNNWVGPDGGLVLVEDRAMRFFTEGDSKYIDFKISVRATEGDVVFGDTKEGSMAIRLAPTMRVDGPVAQGHILNSEGNQGKDAWGKRAKWCDYYGPVEGETVGVAIFDHPGNPRHPTWWHVRNYGLFAANAFGVHNFEGKPEGTGDFEVSEGESATFSYRFYLHKGDTASAGVEGRYNEFAAD